MLRPKKGGPPHRRRSFDGRLKWPLLSFKYNTIQESNVLILYSHIFHIIFYFSLIGAILERLALQHLGNDWSINFAFKRRDRSKADDEYLVVLMSLSND